LFFVRLVWVLVAVFNVADQGFGNSVIVAMPYFGRFPSDSCRSLLLLFLFALKSGLGYEISALIGVDFRRDVGFAQGADAAW
jgi:hypothetical protein